MSKSSVPDSGTELFFLLSEHTGLHIFSFSAINRGADRYRLCREDFPR